MTTQSILTDASVVIEPYEKNLRDLSRLFAFSTGRSSSEQLSNLVMLEKMRGTKFLVARKDRNIIGFIGFWYDHENRYDGKEPPRIIDLAVDPFSDFTEIGTCLMRAAISRINRAGYKRIWVYVNEEDDTRLNFFNNQAFEFVTRIEDWYGTGKRRMVLRLSMR